MVPEVSSDPAGEEGKQIVQLREFPALFFAPEVVPCTFIYVPLT